MDYVDALVTLESGGNPFFLDASGAETDMIFRLREDADYYLFCSVI